MSIRFLGEFEALVHCKVKQQRNLDRLVLYEQSNYLLPIASGKPPKLGTPSSEGIGIYLYSVYLIL